MARSSRCRQRPSARRSAVPVWTSCWSSPPPASKSSPPHRTKPLLQLASNALPTLNWDEALLRIALAGVLGGMIGLERELREREAGLRTHLLGGVGAARVAVGGGFGFGSPPTGPDR